MTQMTIQLSDGAVTVTPEHPNWRLICSALRDWRQAADSVDDVGINAALERLIRELVKS